MTKNAMFGIILLIVSCSILDNHGYPGKISFGSEGGTKEISGDDYPHTLEITNTDDDGVNVGILYDEFASSDSFWVSHKWLTVKAKKGDNKIFITAEPNTTGRSRTLYVSGMIYDSFFETKVTQQLQ